MPPDQLRATRTALDLVGAELAAEVDGLPLALNDTRLVVAFKLPPSPATLDRLASSSGRVVVPVLSEPDVLREVRRAAYDPANAGLAVVQPSELHAARDGAESGGSAREVRPGVPVHLDQLLKRVLEMGGSDLHLTAGSQAKVRVHGSLTAIEGFDVLDSDTIQRLMYAVLGSRQIRVFEQEMELDTSYSVESVGRFRVNMFRQRGSVGAVLRVIPFKIPDFDTLGLPAVVRSSPTFPGEWCW